MGVKVRHVGKSYGHVRAVVDVSFDLDDGAIVVVEGANGSGKARCSA